MKRTHRRQSRNKELTEQQQLKQENRELRKENRALKQENKRLRKQEHFHEDTRLEEEAEQMSFDIDPPPMKCPLCFRPTIKEVNVAGRHWFYCEACEYDSRKNK